MRISDWSSDVCSSDLGFWCDDITEQLAAENAMLASIDSAAVATTKATDAGNFANAAQAERIAAEPAKGGSEDDAGVTPAHAAIAVHHTRLAEPHTSVDAHPQVVPVAPWTSAAENRRAAGRGRHG